jgi:sarcosine oxidase, subunit gamma
MLETSRTARRQAALPAAPIEAGGVTVRPLPARGRFSLRLRAGAADTLGAVAGYALALPINRRAGEGARYAARLGPDEWWLEAPEADADAVAAEIEAALMGHVHALTDVSHRNVGLMIEGAGAADALNAGCPLDLHPRAFPPGTMTRTLLGKAEILLARPGEAPAFEVECWRSFAPYVHGFLVEAAGGL